MSEPVDRLRAALADRYRIERELGAGGMATVYLAADLKHDRKVAVKVLRPELAAVLGAERFVQEIKTTASLQHPHILPLHDSGETDGFLYYVMPFIDGETLRDKLNRDTQLGVEEAVRITTEVADALDYAHRHGVIHRDIKPENILLHDGRPMVADFGIALAVSAAAGGRMTETGLSLGTPHYMSPEQATAEKDLTNRSDIYSLGAVLYEMLTGNPPHMGSSAQQIIMKIVTDDIPPVTKTRKSVPRNVAAALAKSLEKLPADRFGDAAAFARALGDPSFDVTSSAHVPAPTISGLRASRFWVATTIVSMLVATVVSVLHFREAQLPSRTLHLTLPFPRQGGSEGLYVKYDLSPDGRYVALLAVVGSDLAIFVRAMDSLEWRPLAGTINAGSFFWSPDGRSLAFFQDGQLKVVDVGGGPVQDLADVNGGTGAWSPRGIIISSAGALFRVSAAGGEPVPLTVVEPGAVHLYPSFLPDGEHFLYTSEGGSNSGIFVASLDDSAGKRILADQSKAIFAPSVSGSAGHLIYARDGQLMAQPFDPTAQVLRGDPIVLAERALTGGGGDVAVSVSGNILTYLGGRHRDLDSRLVWFDRSGRRLESLGPTGPPTPVSLSPDTRRASVVRRPISSPRGNAWVWDLERGVPAPFTFDTTLNPSGNVIWSPRGDRIAFARTSSEGVGLYVADVATSDTRGVGVADGRSKTVTDWSSDGYLVYTQVDPNSGADLWYFRVGDDATDVGEPVAFRNDRFNTSFGRISPDGRWIAYVSDETGTYEVWVQAFPSGPGKWLIASPDSGFASQPRWSRDGGELFYETGFGGRATIMAAPVRTAPGPGSSPVGDARPLFNSRINNYFPYLGTFFYDVSADGERFLVNVVDAESDPVIHVIVNWEEAIRRE